MYLSITDQEVALVRNGRIVNVYESTETIGDIINGTATSTESSKVGDRVKADSLVSATEQDGICVLNRYLSNQSRTVSSDTAVDSIAFVPVS